MSDDQNIYDQFGVTVIVNACGTNTRLSNAILAPEVAHAMATASHASVNFIDLQAGASRVITEITGAEAGIVISGASAAILVGAAACMTGLDPAVAQRLNSQYRSAAVKRERPHSYDYVQCDKGHSRRLSKLESYG
jgi:D-glucosaminate-6-phosphate ammonia-lyase